MPLSILPHAGPAAAYRRLLALLGVVPLLPLLFAGPAQASRGNPGGFSLSAQSSVPYTLVPHRAAVECQAMNVTLAGGVAIAARLVAATAKAPEHCRLSGTIPAEVGFEINLPTQWNGRLWM